MKYMAESHRIGLCTKVVCAPVNRLNLLKKEKEVAPLLENNLHRFN